MENILLNSKRKPNLIETHRGKEFYDTIFQNFLNENIIKNFFRNSSFGARFAEKFNRTIRDLPKRPVFEKCISNWLDILPTITKQYNNGIHSYIIVKPIQAPLKKIEGYVDHKLLNKRMKMRKKI